MRMKNLKNSLIVVLLSLALFANVLGPATVRFSGGPQGIADQVERVRGSVVHISKTGVYQGSGCFITDDGLLFTAKHVTDGTPGEYVVTLDDGRKFPTRYVIEDKENDIAFMQVDLSAREKVSYSNLSANVAPRVGDPIFIIGSPYGWDNFNTVSLGIISAGPRDLVAREGWGEYERYNWRVMMQSTSPAFPGNSGGPVFDMEGDVVGVLVAGEAPTLNFYVPVTRFRHSVDTVKRIMEAMRFVPVPDESHREDKAY